MENQHLRSNENKEKVVSVWVWIKLYLMMLIPIFGLIYFIYIIVTGCKGKTVKNRLISRLVTGVVLAAFYMLFFIGIYLHKYMEILEIYG